MKTKRTMAEGYNGGDALDSKAEEMIAREVLACQSALLDSVLALDGGAHGYLPTYEDADNLMEQRCPECGEDAIEPTTEEEADETGCDYACRSGSCGWFGDCPDNEPAEVMEWWLVSDWLGDCLSDRGMVVLRYGSSAWWGRCCTGQGIIIDGIMQRIVAETGWGGWAKGQLGGEE